jgi:ATP-dependent DNA ligase
MARLLPEPMLSHGGKLPVGPDWSYELKLDGFRAIVAGTTASGSSHAGAGT